MPSLSPEVRLFAPPTRPIPFPQPNSLGRLCPPPSRTTHCEPTHPLRSLP